MTTVLLLLKYTGDYKDNLSETTVNPHDFYS